MGEAAYVLDWLLFKQWYTRFGKRVDLAKDLRRKIESVD